MLKKDEKYEWGEEIVRRNQETARDGWSTQLSEAARSWTAGHAGSKGPTDCAESALCAQWGGRECTTIKCNPELTLPTGNVQLCIVDCTAYKCIPIYWEGKGLCTYFTLLFSVLNPFHSEHLHEKDFSAPWKLVHCSSVLHQCECGTAVLQYYCTSASAPPHRFQSWSRQAGRVSASNDSHSQKRAKAIFMKIWLLTCFGFFFHCKRRQDDKIWSQSRPRNKK